MELKDGRDFEMRGRKKESEKEGKRTSYFTK